MNKYLLIYLVLINLIGFITFGIDKRKAKKHKKRVPEKRLIFIAIIGGSVGTLLGMNVFHHKTLHKKFKIGIPVILILQVAIALYFSIK